MKNRFYETLKDIEQKSSLYDLNSVENIYMFISGISIGKHIYENSIIDDSLSHFTNYFGDFINDYYFENKKSQNWVKIIRFYSMNDEESKVLFFKLLHLFFESKFEF